MAPLLKVTDLSVQLGGRRVLYGMNWAVERSEFWVILGPNGCGKTTLLSTIMGYAPPSDGEISVGRETYGSAEWPEVRKKIGIVSSAIAQRLPADEPVLETVQSGPLAQIGFWTRSKIDSSSKARRCLRQVGIAHLEGRLWGHLSQGERQKVVLARALMASPRILFLDEACAGLDPVARDDLLIRISQLAQRQRGPALISVTHHVEEIVPEVTHVLLLNRGRIAAAGPKRAILRSPILSEAFGAPLRLRKLSGERWRMDVIRSNDKTD
jgi:iron complex transport system ATP-binding protein